MFTFPILWFMEMIVQYVFEDVVGTVTDSNTIVAENKLFADAECEGFNFYVV